VPENAALLWLALFSPLERKASTGLRIRHVDLKSGCVRIEQRHWRGDIDEPKDGPEPNAA